jgi:hypothetical protein
VPGLIGLTSMAGLTARLWAGQEAGEASNRWPFLVLVIAGLYGYQISTAFTADNILVAQSDAARLVFIFFGVGIARAWELLGLRGGGRLDLFATRGNRAGPPGGAGLEPAGATGPEPGAKP